MCAKMSVNEPYLISFILIIDSKSFECDIKSIRSFVTHQHHKNYKFLNKSIRSVDNTSVNGRIYISKTCDFVLHEQVCVHISLPLWFYSHRPSGEQTNLRRHFAACFWEISCEFAQIFVHWALGVIWTLEMHMHTLALALALVNISI